jgi:hypothetical protein
VPGSTSPRHVYTPDSDLQFVEACAPELEAYLMASVIYWPLAQPKGHSPLPRVTLGGLLLALHRLSAVERDLPAEQAVRLTRARTRIETERLRRTAAIGAKMTLETRARLSLWRTYLDDLSESPASNADLYPTEIRQRAMLQLLATAPETGPLPAEERQAVPTLDARLREMFAAGSFVWDVQLAPAFSPPEYWFLYGRPTEKGEREG